MTTAVYYRHSGASPMNGIMTGLTLAVCAGAVLGAVYGIIDFYSPIIYLNVVAVCGAGAATGAALRTCLRIGKVRNNGYTLLIGLIAGVVALYGSWVTWLAALTEWEVILVSPLDIVPFAQILAIDGVWEMKGTTPTGAGLYSIWGIEALLLIGFTIAIARADPIPFCEACDVWTDPLDVTFVFPSRTLVLLKQDLESGDGNGVIKLFGEDVDAADFLKISTHTCPLCTDSNYVKVEQVTTNAKDETSTKQKIAWIGVEMSTVEALQELLVEPAPQAETFDPSELEMDDDQTA